MSRCDHRINADGVCMVCGGESWDIIVELTAERDKLRVAAQALVDRGHMLLDTNLVYGTYMISGLHFENLKRALEGGK